MPPPSHYCKDLLNQLKIGSWILRWERSSFIHLCFFIGHEIFKTWLLKNSSQQLAASAKYMLFRITHTLCITLSKEFWEEHGLSSSACSPLIDSHNLSIPLEISIVNTRHWVCPPHCGLVVSGKSALYFQSHHTTLNFHLTGSLLSGLFFFSRSMLAFTFLFYFFARIMFFRLLQLKNFKEKK